MTREERLALHLDRKEFRKAPPLPRVKGAACVYVLLEEGRAVSCGAEGYPYCATHRSKTAPLGGTRYLTRGDSV